MRRQEEVLVDTRSSMLAIRGLPIGRVHRGASVGARLPLAPLTRQLHQKQNNKPRAPTRVLFTGTTKTPTIWLHTTQHNTTQHNTTNERTINATGGGEFNRANQLGADYFTGPGLLDQQLNQTAQILQDNATFYFSLLLIKYCSYKSFHIVSITPCSIINIVVPRHVPCPRWQKTPQPYVCTWTPDTRGNF